MPHRETEAARIGSWLLLAVTLGVPAALSCSSGGTATGGSGGSNTSGNTGGVSTGGSATGGTPASTGGTGGTATGTGGTTPGTGGVPQATGGSAGRAASGGTSGTAGGSGHPGTAGSAGFNPFGCKFAWGEPSPSGSPSSYGWLQFMSNWAGSSVQKDGSVNSCETCSWLGQLASTNIIPAYYAYIIGFYGHANGLPDGNQSS
ncbi:MAG TPA: hypothetical protein VLT58_06185, partial [Polyangia bacterium]|nr:hypothetical protein [Polyangia bacterium]